MFKLLRQTRDVLDELLEEAGAAASDIALIPPGCADLPRVILTELGWAGSPHQGRSSDGFAYSCRLKVEYKTNGFAYC